jgi:hypothetical protein
MCVKGHKVECVSISAFHKNKPSNEMQQHQPDYIPGEMDLKAILKFKVWN